MEVNIIEEINKEILFQIKWKEHNTKWKNNLEEKKIKFKEEQTHMYNIIRIIKNNDTIKYMLDQYNNNKITLQTEEEHLIESINKYNKREQYYDDIIEWVYNMKKRKDKAKQRRQNNIFAMEGEDISSLLLN